MSSSTEQNSSEMENLCVLCFKKFNIYSIGVCDHPVCFECSTRMRVLCRQNECPICRGDMPKVIFTSDLQPFTTLYPKYYKSSHLEDIKFGLIFASAEIQMEYCNLLEHRCNICSRERYCCFKTFGQLKDHMRREHELFYCDICVENVKIFSTERRTYTRQELGLHRRKGDTDNTSHRGHPLCEFCDTRFMDSDELFRHLRRTHLFCHLCDADGRHLYYKSIEDLQKHFREEHFLCEEGDCASVPMASAFRTEIDFKAHIAAIHGRNLGKNASKQLRTLELAFTVAPRNNSRHKQQGEYFRDNRVDEEGAAGYEPASLGAGSERMFHTPLTPMDFPALAGSSSQVPALRPLTAFNLKGKLNMNDFPSLGNNSDSRPSSGVTISTSRNTNNFPALGKPSSSQESRVSVNVHNNQNVKAPQVSIHVNYKPNGNFHTQISTAAVSSQAQKPAEAFPALGASSKQSSQPQWVQMKSKKHPEKPSNVAPAPKLPPSDLNQFPNLPKGKVGGKKTSSIQVPVSGNWVNLNSLKKEGNNKKNNDKGKQREVETQEAAKNNKNDDKNKKKKKGKSTNNNEENNTKVDVKQPNTSENKQSVRLQENDAKPVERREEKEKKEEAPKPPPGFKLPPPPGFDNGINDFPCLGVPNDLTFTTSLGQSYAITSKVNNYKQPSNFSSRNQNIIKKLSMVSGNDTVNEFKLRSEMFRNGQLSPEKYYEHCKKVLSGNFEEFFPEILVLLPDIGKQQSLFDVHTGKSKKNLVVCENCKQVIMKKELTEHYKYHVFENQCSSQVNNNIA